jgi:hypothetical protein
VLVTPGLDGITFRVWKELWPVLGSVVLNLYQASLDLKYVTQWWCTAKIVVLRKPNKPDYSRPKAYRSIWAAKQAGRTGSQPAGREDTRSVAGLQNSVPRIV